MAGYYIVAKVLKKMEYYLVKIDDGNDLKTIDLYTSKFEDKKSFLNHLADHNLKLDDDVDLFIASNYRDYIRRREIVYGDNEVAKFAKESVVNTLPCSTKFLNMMKYSKTFPELVEKNYYVIMKKYKEAINNSMFKSKISLNNKNFWIKDNYLMGRDAIYAMEDYEKNIKDLDEEELKNKFREKLDLDNDRKVLNDSLLIKFREGMDQMMFVNDASGTVHLKNVYLENIPDNSSLNKSKHIGNMNSKTSKLTIPYDYMSKTADGVKVNEILSFLTNFNSMPIHSITSTEDGKYNIDFDVLEDKFGFKYTEEDKKVLNKLLGAPIKKNLFFVQMYSDENHQYSAASEEAREQYKRDLQKTLVKYRDNHPAMYVKAYNFCEIHSRMISKDIGKKESYVR
ncbi:MAG: hypothetical protein IJI43_02955 [Bacilli bacterium]|nr:hypothetical protein [Bacilli bacterium]